MSNKFKLHPCHPFSYNLSQRICAMWTHIHIRFKSKCNGKLSQQEALKVFRKKRGSPRITMHDGKGSGIFHSVGGQQGPKACVKLWLIKGHLWQNDIWSVKQYNAWTRSNGSFYFCRSCRYYGVLPTQNSKLIFWAFGAQKNPRLFVKVRWAHISKVTNGNRKRDSWKESLLCITFVYILRSV